MKRILSVLSILCLLSVGFGCAPKEHSVVGYCFDTVITITAACSQEVLDGALALCQKYDTLFDRTDPDSEVWKLNHSLGAPTVVSEDTAFVLNLANEMYQKSGGAFDITVAPVTALWDFHSETPTPPNPETLKRAVSLVNGSCVEVSGTTVTLKEGVTIDLGGIAKGFVADRVKSYLLEQGCVSACINLGGNVLTIGGKPNGEAWRVGIRDPKGGPNDVVEVLSVTDRAVVTSGTYERCFSYEGTFYHHILNPETGMPVQRETASVTIVAESAAIADALSTACFVLDEQAAGMLARSYEAKIIYH